MARQDVEANAESWDRFAFDAADVSSIYPEWRSSEAIMDEGAEMAKRHFQLFQDAKRAKSVEDRIRYIPPDFLGQISEEGGDQ